MLLCLLLSWEGRGGRILKVGRNGSENENEDEDGAGERNLIFLKDFFLQISAVFEIIFGAFNFEEKRGDEAQFVAVKNRGEQGFAETFNWELKREDKEPKMDNRNQKRRK
jgi:hypothetical protein